MVFRRLLFNLLNNPQFIEKLSESRPIRRAAQITAFAITKAQLTGKDAAQRLLRSDTVRQLTNEAAPRNLEDMGRKMGRVKDTFVRELRTGMKQIKDGTKRPGGK
ncbi:protein NCBP2AS2 [Aquarana catesbeiana]|uniref:protein NCBP2AS2 n=1 Tax=Aquarana catesbeiana TaxID=8400 RepID=UPI003CC9D75E